jgi:hypothetical protein
MACWAALPANTGWCPNACKWAISGRQRVVCPAPQSNGAINIFPAEVWGKKNSYFYKSRFYEHKIGKTPHIMVTGIMRNIADGRKL